MVERTFVVMRASCSRPSMRARMALADSSDTPATPRNVESRARFVAALFCSVAQCDTPIKESSSVANYL